MTQTEKDIHKANLINLVEQMISENLSESLLIEQLSEHAGLSKYHLHRVFVAQTGFEVAEYIQRRKMERALALLEQGEASVIDVALAVGYESHSSFSRVFKQSYSVTPTQVLKGASYEPLIRYKKKSKQELVEPDTKWLYLEQKRILGKYCRGFEQSSFAQIATKTFEDLTDKSLYKDYLGSEPIGVSISNPWGNEPEKAEFFCGFLSGLEDGENSGLESFIWPEGNYICTTYTGPYHLMWQYISKLHSYWAEHKQVKLMTRQVVQRYLNHPTTTKPEDLTTELYFPVEITE